MQFKLFPSFFDHPQKIRFQEQEVDETIELFLRRHFITNLGWITLALIGLVLPVFLIQLDANLGTNVVLKAPTVLIIEGLITYYLLIIGYVIENFLFWYFNIYIVTNLHLEDISLNNLLSREVNEIELRDIEDVTSTINGVIRSLFNFGDVNIRTAAKKEEVIFAEVPRPDFVADRIQDLEQALER